MNYRDGLRWHIIFEYHYWNFTLLPEPHHANSIDLERKSSLIWKETAENCWAWFWHFVTQVNMIMMVSLGKIIMWQFPMMKEHFCHREFKCRAPGFPDVYQFQPHKTPLTCNSLNDNFKKCWVVIKKRGKTHKHY